MSRVVLSDAATEQSGRPALNLNITRTEGGDGEPLFVARDKGSVLVGFHGQGVGIMGYGYHWVSQDARNLPRGIIGSLRQVSDCFAHVCNVSTMVDWSKGLGVTQRKSSGLLEG